MTRIEASILVPAPLEEVFQYASDWQRWSDWFEGVSDFRPTTDKVRCDGARYAYKAHLLGLRMSVETEIKNFVEGRGWEGVARKGMPHRTEWRFESGGAHTHFTYVLEYQIPVPVVGSLLDRFFMKRQWRRLIAASLGNLRRHFEGRRTEETAAGGHGS